MAAHPSAIPQQAHRGSVAKGNGYPTLVYFFSRPKDQAGTAFIQPTNWLTREYGADDAAPVPEPATLALVGVGLAVAGVRGRRRR